LQEYFQLFWLSKICFAEPTQSNLGTFSTFTEIIGGMKGRLLKKDGASPANFIKYGVEKCNKGKGKVYLWKYLQKKKNRNASNAEASSTSIMPLHNLWWCILTK
jgi:hypothetical protein